MSLKWMLRLSSVSGHCNESDCWLEDVMVSMSRSDETEVDKYWVCIL